MSAEQGWGQKTTLESGKRLDDSVALKFSITQGLSGYSPGLPTKPHLAKSRVLGFAPERYSSLGLVRDHQEYQSLS